MKVCLLSLYDCGVIKVRQMDGAYKKRRSLDDNVTAGGGDGSMLLLSYMPFSFSVEKNLRPKE